MVLIAQISDLHLVPLGSLCSAIVDTNALGERAVESVNRLRPRPDAVVVTGDVIDTNRESDYAVARQILERLEMPFFLLSGNHDDSSGMKRVFAHHAFAACQPRDRLYYAADIGRMRLIVLDSSVPGASYGAVSPEQLTFLDRELAAAADRPALVALHHPPVATGHPKMDSIGLLDPSGLAGVIARHRNVARVICGHCHRAITAVFAGTVVSIAPSTAHQIAYTLDGDATLAFTLEPPGLLLHRWAEPDGMTTHQMLVDRFPGPFPFV